MKGISAFVATILLVGFTVAVGAIISTWFLTYTRTTASGVGAATACAAGILDVVVPAIDSNSVTVLLTNRGTINITNLGVSISCGGNTQSYMVPSLMAGTSNVTRITITCSTDYSNIVVSAIGSCVGGGTISGSCSGSACKFM